MSMKVLGVIPARFQSTRLPKKVLQLIGDKPLIQHVWERSLCAKKINRLVVATDHDEIMQVVKSFGGEAILTDPNHTSGTDRIVEVASSCECDIVINIQGDEPFISAEAIDALVGAFENNADLEVATLCHRETDTVFLTDSNVVKVVKDNNDYALYFSRAGIPFDREKRQPESFFKHIGIYAFTKKFLMAFPTLSPSELEEREKLEQLRILSNGGKIKVIETEYDSFGIDTELDLQHAQKIYSKMQQ
ncbi:3-deoxy-manno-octulosonate cytidylyltransferase [Candidatus Omnitrophota bacterium]